MRAMWCGFALGVIALQRQAALPGWGAWVGLVLAIAFAAWWAVWALGAAAPADVSRVFGLFGERRWRTASGWAAVWLAAGCAGFGYAAWRAEVRLAQALPAAWETRDLHVTGYISSLPSYGASGASFLFRVESWEANKDAPKAAARLPQLIQLSWVAREAPLPLLVPGARWRLALRLKRPHGNGNFGLRDTEATLLARGVRATGYVSDPEHAVRLPVDASGIGVRIERARAALRARIDAVLGEAPHRGIVIALATGAQDAVSDADWRLMRNTGTSHLVAISGLHLAFVAGLAGWVAGALWRRALARCRGAALRARAEGCRCGCVARGGHLCRARRFQCAGAARALDAGSRCARAIRRARGRALARAGVGARARTAARSVGGDGRRLLALVLRRRGDPLRGKRRAALAQGRATRPIG